MDAGRVLREARRRAHLTQRGLAAKAHVPQSMIARIESGAVMPRVDTLDSLLESCGEGLYTSERWSAGVDKTLAREALGLPVSDRVVSGRTSAENIYRFAFEAQRSRGVVREGRQSSAVRELLEVLLLHGVDFVIVGGIAAVAQGSPIVTFDLDICYSRDEGNIERLEHALLALNATLRGAPDDLPNVIDVRFLKNGLNFTFKTRLGALDCLGEPAGTRGFDDLVANATMDEVEGLHVRIAAVSDLMRMKRAAGRPKDLAHLAELTALQEEIDRRAKEGRTAKRERRSPD